MHNLHKEYVNSELSKFWESYTNKQTRAEPGTALQSLIN